MLPLLSFSSLGRPDARWIKSDEGSLCRGFFCLTLAILYGVKKKERGKENVRGLGGGESQVMMCCWRKSLIE